MNSHAGTAADSTMPSFDQWIAWPAACSSFWWTLQLELLSELARPSLTLPPWMAWYNGTEQLG